MEFKSYDIEGLVLIKPKLFSDDRGFFMEAYHQRKFAEAGIPCAFVQDNESHSIIHTLRGLHFQVNKVQAKLVRVVSGSIWDVAVDIRPGSPTFGQWRAATLTSENHHQFFVPAGFAHGFQVLSETARVIYKCSDFYSPPDDRGLLWSDPDLAIDWPNKDQPVLSPKDQEHPLLKDLVLS